MPLKKLGEATSFNPNSDILTPKQALPDEAITQRFIKLAKKLKRVAPKAQDFLYGATIMMHAAEASLINQKTGEPLLNPKGQPVKGSFKQIKVKGKDSVKWESEDNIMPYKNANGDIFPESELMIAAKRWIGRPLCKDHKSDSVDGIRGIIVDTFYDPKFKRVHALFALDKKNYSDLARKVETGYANAVSMGTAVGRSVCTSCGNVATTEKDYCKCIKAHINYGEINLDLNPIELSLVVSPADHLAKIHNIVASVNDYVNKKQARIDQLVNDCCVNPTELQSIADSIGEIQAKLNHLMGLQKTASDKTAGEMGEVSKAIEVLQNQMDRESEPEKQNQLKAKIDKLVEDIAGEDKEAKVWPQATMGGGFSSSPISDQDDAHVPTGLGINPTNRFANIGEDAQGTIGLLRSKISAMQETIEEIQHTFSKEEKNMNSARLKARAKTRRAYWLGTEEPTPGKPQYKPMGDYQEIRDTEDKQMTGVVETGSDGLFPGDEEKLKEIGRDGLNLKAAELEDRKLKRHAYFQGGGGINEPTPGQVKYEKEDAKTIRDTQDKQMTGTYDMGGTDGMVPSDKPVKEMLLRAKLRATFTKVADEKGAIRKDASHWDIFAGDKLILSATGSEIYGDELDANWNYLNSAEYGRDVMKMVRSDGFDRVAFLLKGADEAPVMPEVAIPAAAPAPEAKPVDAKPEEPKKDKTQEKIDAALNAVEEKIEEIRKLTGGEDKLVSLDVDVAKKGPDALGDLNASQDDLRTVLALMDESADELALASEAVEKAASVDEKLLNAVGQALSDNEAIMAQAALAVEAKKKKAPKKEVKCEKCGEVKCECEKADKKEAKAQELLDRALKARAENRAAMLAKVAEVEKCQKCGDAMKEDHACDMTVEEDKKEVCAARKAEREALVAEAADKVVYPKIHDKPLTLDKAETVTEPTFFQAHPNGGTVTELTGTKTPEAKVETIEEQHDAIREVAEAQPVSVREAAAILQEKVVEGSMKADDMDKLVAEGKADAETVAYWKKFFAQAPAAGSFGAEMSKEFAAKKATAANETAMIKMRRAYDVGLQAQEKGIINSTRAALDNYVDEILQFDDASFESNKRIIASYNSAKSGKLPIIGSNAVSEPMNVTASAEPTVQPSVLDSLNVLGWK